MGALLDQWRKRKEGGSTTEGSLLERWNTDKKYRDVDTSGVNDAYFESYNQAASDFFGKKELHENSYDQWQGLTKQADTIRAWAWQNRDKLGSNYDSIMSATDLSEVGQYWGQFGSAEDYAKAFGEYTNYQEMMNADLGVLEQEISDIESRLEPYDKIKRLGRFNPKSADLREKYDSENEQLAAKRAYYNEAKNLQAGKAYEEQARLDPAFARLAEQGSVGVSDGMIKNRIAYFRSPESEKDIVARRQMGSYEYLAARLMTDDEFATYNYLLAKGDKDGAEDYLQSLKYQINQRGADNAAANLKGRTVAEIAWAIPAGLDQFGSGLASAVKGVLGEDGYMTPSAIQMSSGKIREDLADDGVKVFGSSAGQLAYDTLSTTANMAPSILAAAAINFVAPGAGAYVGAGLMGASAGGNAYAEALNNGYSRDNALAYGLFVGASEAALQSVLGGISSVSGVGNLTAKVAQKADAINNALLRVAAKYGISVLGETTEEELQNFLEPLFKTIFLGEEYDMPTIEELVQTAIVTALSTGMLESGGMISSTINENKTYKDTYGQAQKELVAEGLELDPQSRYYQRLNEKLNRGKELSGNEIRNVVTRNERAIRKLGQDTETETVAETAEEKAVPDTMAEMVAQNAPKIAQERTESTETQTVAERENAPVAKESAAQAEPVSETAREDVQSALEKASRDYGAQAKAMAATYMEGQDVAEYNDAFRIAYDMGASGVNLSYVEGMQSYLTDSQKKIAYEAGKASQETRAKRLEKSNAKKETGGTQRKKGVVRGQGVSIEELSAKFNDTQRESYKIMSTIAEITGIDIVLYKSEADAKGNFTDAQGKYKKSEPGTLYIDINAGLNNIKSAGDLANYTMLRTFSHEFVHFIENWNPVWYNELRRAVFDHLENADELISREAAESGLPYERASREVVAEALTDVLPDSTFLEDLANNHKSIFEKLYAKLKEFVANIKKHFASLSPNANKAAQTLKQSGKYAEEIVKLFDKAAAGAVENYQATVAEQKAEKDMEEVKAEAKKIDQEKPKKEKKPKKIASTKAVIDEINADGMVDIDTDGKTVAPQYSRRTWTESEYVTDREKTAKAISKELGVSVETALSFIDNINAVSKLIADDKARLDYAPNAVDSASVLKPNSEYKWSVDMSTLCAKRLLFTGTFDAIQKIMADTAFDSEDIVRIRQMMEERGYEVACGFCYVESTRRELGPITQDFIERYKLSQKTGKPISRINSEGKEVELTKTKDQMKTTVDASTDKFFPEDGYTPTMADLNTTDIDLVKKNHPQVYEAYLNFMNARGQAKPKLLETRAEYKGEILRTFKSKSAVTSRNNSGGLRLQSFSDFEVPHLIDMMQIALDMSRVGLKSQAYTKVPAFAKVFGNTGIKINLSLVAKGSGLDADGNLIFDDKEGMPHEEAFHLRDRFSKNVGTILVGKNDAHIIAAMADPRIDFIIPFHKSSWKESLYDALGLTGYEDYTDTQNERSIDPERKIKNYDPSEYWDFSKTGDENAQIYLERCKQDGRIPKFPQFQSYPGYWKLLIDFKMYDNDGVGSPQEVVRPIYDEQSQSDIKEIFDTYKGGHGTLPVAQDVVDDFVKEYKDKKGVQEQRRAYTDQDQAYMDAVESGDMETAQRMVNEAAKEAGYTEEVFHGMGGRYNTYKSGNGQYGSGVYFTADEGVARGYGEVVDHLYVKVGKIADYEDAYKALGKTDDQTLDDFAQSLGFPNFEEMVNDWDNDPTDVASNPELMDLLKNKGFEGFVDEGNAGFVLWDFAGIAYRIKSADPVTYDDDGNVIPLSERFDEAQEDIRYQRRANYASGLTSAKPGEGMSYEVSVKDYTLKEVANMYHLGNLGAEYDALFDKVYAVCDNMGITFDVVPIIRNEQGNDVPGVNTGDQVSFNVRSFNSTKVDNEYKSKVILHEMLHAATTYALRKYADKRGGATVNMPKNIYDSCAEMERVFNAIKNNPLFKNEYGIKNGKEMIAELSNPDFVEKLKATYPSAWHGLLDQICKLFGINKSFTNYDKLKKAVDEILAHPDYQLAKEHFALVDQNATYLDESQYADADVQEQRMREDTDASYMAAVEDGDTETLQRMVEKAAREAGFDSPKLYHGTNTFGFTSIDTKKSNDRVSFFATDSLETAGSYSGTNKVRELGEQSASSLGIYQFYANTEGMLELDADGAESNHIKLDGIEKKFNDFMMTKSWKTHATAKQLAKYAKQSGYSGVIIKNVIDTATPESRSAANPSTVYIFFDPQKQLASADTVTYDDDGYVVPLSERFSSESTDIRYQRRDGRMTDQEVLAYAVDLYKSDASVAEGLTEAEKNALELFKQRLAKLDSLIEQRAEQGTIYRENTFQKGGDRSIAQAAHNRMQVLDEQIARASAQLLDVQEKTVLQGVLQKARKVVEQQERARGDEKLKRWRERRENAAAIKKYRDRIEADYKDLVDWLNHPLNKDVTKHVNENIKGIVIPFLLSFDFTSKQQLRGGEATKADQKHVAQAQKLLNMLHGLDDEVRYSGEYDLPLNFDDRLAKHIETVKELMEAYEGETVLNRMTAEELKNLSVLMANLKAAITTLNKFHTNAMFAHVSAAGDTTIRDLKALKDYEGNAVDTFLFWKNIRPDYAWDRFGSGGRSINLALREGQSKLAWNAKAIIDYAQSTFTAKEREEWENKVVEVSISDERKVKTTVAALMSFYKLSKRAQGRKHILDGGVTVSDVEIRESRFSKKKRVSGRYGRFTEADIEAMNAALTDRQREVADKLQQFMEKQGGEWGNHVTLARFGEKAFGEKGYFPISVDKQSLSTKPDQQAKGAELYRLLNMGFTKELSENTKQPLLLHSIFDVFSTHMADMAQYNAMALPVLDAIRWLNYKEYDLGDGTEVNNLRAEMKRAFGSPVVSGGQSSGYAERFVTHILQAYNGTEAQGTPGDSLGMKMLHTYNRAQIAFNVRVVVQQPMALTRAAMVIEPKYIVKALDPKKLKANMEDMLTHSGIAAWKDLGYYDINISRGLAQMIKQDSTFTEKITEVGLKPAEWADKATWAVIWAACKEQLAAKGITDYKDIERLFDDVIYKTQVVDSVLTKSEFMRDKGFFARSTSSFMSEPTTTASMVLDAYDQYRMDMRRGMSARQAWNVHKRNIGRTVLVYSVGAIMLAAVQAAADGLRDDDDYQNIAEKWDEAFWSNLLDELSPLNKLPLVSTIWELFKVGLDTFTNLDVYGNPPSAAWAQWFDTLAKAWEITMELSGGETNYTWYAAIYKYLQVASGLSGMPFAAFTREVITVWNNSVGAFAPSLKVKSYELKEQTEIKYALMDGYLTAGEAAEELWNQGLVGSREEAQYTAEAWDFVNQHPEYSDLTVTAYVTYKENCQGVDIGYFYQAWKYYNQAEADRDRNGDPIAGSKKRKVLDFIYQMNIPAEQKKKIIKCFYK